MVNWAGLIGWGIVFHLFGVIIWIGGLLVIASMLSLATEEVGAARERLIWFRAASSRSVAISGRWPRSFRHHSDPARPRRSDGRLAAYEAGAGARAAVLPLPPLPPHPGISNRSVRASAREFKLIHESSARCCSRSSRSRC